MVSYSLARVGDRPRSPHWTVVSYTPGRVGDGPRSPHWTVVSVNLARMGDGPRSPVWWTMVSYTLGRVGDGRRSAVWWTVVSYILTRVTYGPRSAVLQTALPAVSAGAGRGGGWRRWAVVSPRMAVLQQEVGGVRSQRQQRRLAADGQPIHGGQRSVLGDP